MIAQVALLVLGDRYYPYLRNALLGPAYLLLLPAVAAMHTRHAPLTRNGAVLGTATGAATAVLLVSATLNIDAQPVALFALGMWWWIVGKLWAMSGAISRPLGVVTAALAPLAFLGSLGLGFGTVFIAEVVVWDIARYALVIWVTALAVALWSDRDQA